MKPDKGATQDYDNVRITHTNGCVVNMEQVVFKVLLNKELINKDEYTRAVELLNKKLTLGE